MRNSEDPEESPVKAEGQGSGLAARLRATLREHPTEARLELARHLAQLQAKDDVPVKGLASRLRISLGGQPLGATAVCIKHQWVVQVGGRGVVCKVCGLSSGHLG